ncbi:ABC transporter permease subunit [Nakamurella panacisegetis]|uniref:ABC transporter permease subunit n=1 Tax=Nakamurella panacisegetis TaxID=1090615 RepID=UPI0018D30039|nr:ABC transporter permease subunit [Nakamurella panacisegetis]
MASFFILIGATFIAYVLVSNAGDPLENARGLPNPTQRLQTMATITQTLHLDVNPVFRYFIWLKGVGGCFVGKCDFGVNIAQVPVNGQLSLALGSSLKLITASTVLAVFLGIAIGIITALRQYSGLDYTVTLITFLFFSLPVIWIGIVLKDIFALQFNTFLQRGAQMSWATIIIASVLIGLIAYSLFAGELRRRLMTGALSGLVAFAVFYFITVQQWLLNPSLGPVVIALLGVGLALGVTVLTSGLGNRKSLYTALTTVAVGVALWYPLQFFFHNGMSGWKLFGLLVIALIVGSVIGYLYGGDDRGLSARNGAITAFTTSFVIFVDRMFRAWHSYNTNTAINGRPIRTLGPSTPNLQGDFWIQLTDTMTHLILPTITLMLISLATHSRFSRASMLEVMNMDYIRTARSKGLTERTVVMRHALRNALIPMATVVAFDIAGLIGGAVLTETVFGWKSMGQLFQQGLLAHDPNPVMAFFVVSATIAVLANLLADLAYAGLDPRIRVGS